MLQAKLNNGMLFTLIHRSRKEIDRLRKEGRFYCPSCHEPVFIKAGVKMIPHFAHYKHSDCPANEGGEGLYHERGKLLLYQWLKSQGLDVTLEEYIPSIKQRPDCMVRIHKKLIGIEYQCARISTKEIKDRNEGYLSLGIKPIWILGANRLARQTKTHFKLDTFTQNFIHQYTSDSPTVIYYFCPDSLQFIMIQHVIMTRSRQAVGKLKIIDIRNLHFKELFSRTFLNHHDVYSIWKKEKERFRLHPRKNTYGMELAWRQWLYLKGTYIEYLPSIIYLPVESQFLMKSNLWDWQSRICLDILHPLPIGGVVSLQRMTFHLKKHFKSPTLFPLIRPEKHPIKEYLQILTRLGMLESLPNDRYRKIMPLSFYKHIEEAIKGDNELIQKLIMI